MNIEGDRKRERERENVGWERKWNIISCSQCIAVRRGGEDSKGAICCR